MSNDTTMTHSTKNYSYWCTRTSETAAAAGKNDPNLLCASAGPSSPRVTAVT